MLRSVHVLVFALVASLGSASGAHALGSETALRQNFEHGPDRVGALAPEAGGTRQQNLSHATAVASECSHAARGVNNAVPKTLARVIPGDVKAATLGRPGTADVFVTAADDIAGMNAAQIAERLTIPPSSTFTVIEFATPAKGLASPVLRTNPGFVGRGLTAGGAREFVLPNGPIPTGAVFRMVGQ